MAISVWFAGYLVVATIGLLQALIVAWLGWDHFRHARNRRFRIDFGHLGARVALIVPCKGLDLELFDNLRQFFVQDYDDYLVTYVVESEDDPAVEVIRRVQAEFPHIESRLVVAGLAGDCSQKLHNLKQATRHVPADAQVLAFADSDAHPQPDWLRHLVGVLKIRSEVVASTGYRCLVPAQATWANWLLYCINSSITGMLSAHRKRNLIWGGSWAIWRDDFEKYVQPRWSNILNDDLSATEAVLQSGRGIDFESRCMVASPSDTTFSGMFEFVRRQYMQARFYAPRWWWLALFGFTHYQLAFWSSLTLAVYGGAVGAAWAIVPASALGLSYCLGWVGVCFRQRASRLYLPDDQEKLQGVQAFEQWCFPVAAFLGWVGFLGSLWGNTIVWRGNCYRLHPGGRMELVSSGSVKLPQTAAAADLKKKAA